jgi:hypothetical protein
MCQKNAGAKEPNKQHRRHPLILTARWWDDSKRLSVSGRFRRSLENVFPRAFGGVCGGCDTFGLSRGAALCTSVATLQHGDKYPQQSTVGGEPNEDSNRQKSTTGTVHAVTAVANLHHVPDKRGGLVRPCYSGRSV